MQMRKTKTPTACDDQAKEPAIISLEERSINMKTKILLTFILVALSSQSTTALAVDVEHVTPSAITEHQAKVYNAINTTGQAIKFAHAKHSAHKKAFMVKLDTARAQFERDYAARVASMNEVGKAIDDYRAKKASIQVRSFGLEKLSSRISWLWADKDGLRRTRPKMDVALNQQYLPAYLTEPKLVQAMDNETLRATLNNMKLATIDIVAYYKRTIRPMLTANIKDRVMDNSALRVVDSINFTLFWTLGNYSAPYISPKKDRSAAIPPITYFVDSVAESFPSIVKADFIIEALKMEAELLAFRDAYTKYQLVELNRMAAPKKGEFDLGDLIENR